MRRVPRSRAAARRAQIPGAPTDGWLGKVGVDAKWENCIVVADAKGNIVERWTQWDKILQRPHFVAINPYDPEKHVWIVDDHMGRSTSSLMTANNWFRRSVRRR